MPRDIDEVRAEMNAAALERGPLCPADLDPEVWAAVAANYPDGDWSPGPEYHVEYRDAASQHEQRWTSCTAIFAALIRSTVTDA